MKNFIYCLRLAVLFILIVNLVGCGSAGGGSSSSNEEPKTESQSSPDVVIMQSIGLKSKADLPACEAANETQLAYIMDIETFFVCENSEWVEVDIKGEDGSDGQDAVAELDFNEWQDPFTGTIWVLAEDELYTTAVTTCSTSGFKMPSRAEAQAALYHGIREAAVDKGFEPDFWIDKVGFEAYITLDNSNGHTFGDTNGVNTNSAFCIKL